LEAGPREIRFYETTLGRIPFEEWLDSLEGQDIHEIIMLRLDKVQRGSLGDTKSVGKGVSEFIIDDEGGYRLYYGLIGKRGELVVLLHGGMKKTQAADIKIAQDYWNDEEFNNGEGN
jgi:putative addiction module killer protein